ncbi:MAG: hypothetical protein GC152_01155 [Alphaproteobacteria bacterium]|nr:hypothetical protein [Alphaproteobacteria bacterium]
MVNSKCGALAARAMLAIASLGVASGAHAQVRKGTIDERVVSSMSGYEVIALMRSISAPTRLTDENPNDNEKTLEARTGEGTVYVFLAGCNGPGAYAQCSEIQPTIYFKGEGVTLAQLNRFNLDDTTISIAGLLDDGRGVVFVRRQLEGGVTASHVRWTIGQFLKDAEALLKSIDPSGAPAISLPAAVTSETVSSAIRVNGVGVNAPSLTAPEDAGPGKVAND